MNAEQRLLVDLTKALDKPDWWDTCTAYNDCSICPYGVTETGKYYRCGAKNKEILEG